MEARLKGVFALVAWGVFCTIAMLSWFIFIAGVWRDERPADPVLDIEVSRAGQWKSQPFRVWGDGEYKLFISSVNFDSTHLGAPLTAQLDVQVVSPGGETLFARTYGAGQTGLLLPVNYTDADLTELHLDASVMRRYELRARVVSGDARFAPATTQLKLYRKQYDPGMGGMINYVMIFPAMVFSAVAFVMALSLLRGGRKWPLAVTSVMLLPVLAYFVLR
jgi:hypothetical protein